MTVFQHWTATVQKGDECFTIGATVPGCLHTDLQRAGKLPADLFWRDNNECAGWVESCDVTYACTFTAERTAADACLRFDGLDTYCDVFCNGVKIGEADDMFVPWTFPVGHVLRAGENRLEVRFRSPVREVAGREARAGAFTTERLYTRRMQCAYGWDWLGRFVTMGIWRPVSLLYPAADTLPYGAEGIYITTEDITPDAANVKIVLDFPAVSGDGWVEMAIDGPDGDRIWYKRRRILDRTLTEYVSVPQARLWYPRGYGEQPLYTFTCRAPGCVGEENCTHTQCAATGESRSVVFGIRRIAILEIEDAPDSDAARLSARIRQYPHLREWDRNEGSSGFLVTVNGVKIFCQGANWVPTEPFPSAETPEKVARMVAMAERAGINMLRVWGGGVFASETFYAACDRAGILVTQDFLMACGSYPEEDAHFCSQLRREAAAAALSLRNHACLAWWSGDNENAVNGDENLPVFPGRIAALDCIGPVLARLDSARRFLASSPYGGVPYASATRGTAHNTQYLGNLFAWVREGDFRNAQYALEQYLARFTAEQPAMGMPFASSLRKFLTEEDIYGADTAMSEYHTKNNPGLGEISLYGYMERMAAGMFGAFADGEDRLRKLQWLHAEWIRLSMELFRRHAWYASGILYWMFEDCWPAATGWSLVDYYGNAKPGFYAFRRAAADVVCSVTDGDPAHGGLDADGRTRVWLSVHGSQAAAGRGRLYRYHLTTGAEDFVREFPIHGAAGGCTVVYETDAIPLDADTVLLCDVVTDRGTDRAYRAPFSWAWMRLPPQCAPVVLARQGTEITVTAPVTLPMAFLDDAGVVLSENGMFLKKGEVRTLRYEA